MQTTLSILNVFAALIMSCSPAGAIFTNMDEAASAAGSGTAAGAEASSAAGSDTQAPLLLIGIGMHIEPMGVTAQGYQSGKGDYSDAAYFNRHVNDIETIAAIIEEHGGVMTVQAQSPFTEVAVLEKNPILSNLAASGHEIALHFHEDAHLGKNSQDLPVEQWCAVMKEEIALIKLATTSPAGGVTGEIRYWSGGNLYPDLFEAAACAGLNINSDWKNPLTQTTDSTIMGVHPWRPAGGTDGTDFHRLGSHDPSGPVVFLPEGMIHRDRPKSEITSGGGDEAYFKFLEDALMDSLEEAEAGKVNVYHITIHPAEFRGRADHPFGVIDRFLSEVVDPLVSSGRVQWATFGEMADAYTAWEETHPGMDMRE